MDGATFFVDEWCLYESPDPSGVYSVRLTAGNFNADRNMVLLK